MERNLKRAVSIGMTANICSSLQSQHGRVLDEIRSLLLPWGFSLLFPLPLIMVEAGAVNSDIATLYASLSLAWLATEVFRRADTARSPDQWRARIAAFLGMASLNALVFIGAGLSAPIKSNIPWPLLVCLASAPAIGLVPWLVLKMKQPQGALVIAALIVGSIKLAGCLVARIVYGPDFLQKGFASADWQSAKLMISCMWAGTLIVSFMAGLAAYRGCMVIGKSPNEPG